MRLCASENLGEAAVVRLRQAGHDVLWIREIAPGSTNPAVLACAHAENRLLLTFDKDFGGLGLSSGLGGVLRDCAFPHCAAFGGDRSGMGLLPSSLRAPIGTGTTPWWTTLPSACVPCQASETAPSFCH